MLPGNTDSLTTLSYEPLSYDFMVCRGSAAVVGREVRGRGPPGAMADMSPEIRITERLSALYLLRVVIAYREGGDG
jgi:hypothetical protein